MTFDFPKQKTLPSENFKKEDSDSEGLMFEQRQKYREVRQWGREWNNSQRDNRIFISEVESGKSAQELLEDC